ncbi:MAG: radical SAM protein [SAR202 cluster bacterium]|jgi:radical SAM protein with 4Fe4S-binding SPASM domain|nr:radical SAM protein [SAR202 cluster bacterium]|tara:strand:- start:13843 stop:14775 length:933 start_codon:yes stop_codon:yes gene_type:complete
MSVTDPFKKFYKSDFYQNNYKYEVSEFPKLLEIEPSSKCNMKCVFCGRQDMKRPQISMDYNLYKKIIDECGEYDVFGISGFAGWGEPLLNPHIFNMIKYAHKYNILVHLYTNGLLLTPDISKKLLDMDLDKIKISLQGASEENYSVMRANPYYKRIINNIKTLVDLRDNTGSDLFIQVSTSITNETKEQTDEFEKFWRNIVDDFYSDITTFRRLRGVQKVEEFIKDHKIKNERLLRQKKCVDVRTRLVVHADGYVPICCSDFRREILIGNANKQTLKEIWNSPKLTKIRQILENNEKDKIPFCSLCFNLR